MIVWYAERRLREKQIGDHAFGGHTPHERDALLSPVRDVSSTDFHLGIEQPRSYA